MDRKTQRTSGIRHQPLLISGSSGTSTLPHGEFVEVSHHGQPIPVRLQSTPLPHVHHVVPAQHGQYPSGFSSAMPMPMPMPVPMHNRVPSHGRMPSALDDPMQQGRFAPQPAQIEDCDVYRAVDPYRPGVFDEADDEFQPPLPSFMNKWLKKSDRQNSYEPLELDALSSNKPPEVGAPPGKRQWPFAGDMSSAELLGLHHFTLQPPEPPEPPEVRTFDLDEVRARLMASSNPQKLTPEAPELPGSGRHLDELAMNRTLSSGDPMDLDPVAFVRAVKRLPLGSKQNTLRALAKKNSFEKMVEFVETLTHHQIDNLLNQSWKWIAERNLFERNPEASQLMALLILFTSYTPSLKELDEFMNLLPLTWPPALEHLRKACLDGRAALFPSAQRRAFLVRLSERYGGQWLPSIGWQEGVI